MTRHPYRALKWISAIGVGLALIGLMGLLVAFRAFPNSHLLGGWALIFGPLYGLGALTFTLAALCWVFVGLRACVRWLTTKNVAEDSTSSLPD